MIIFAIGDAVCLKGQRGTATVIGLPGDGRVTIVDENGEEHTYPAEALELVADREARKVVDRDAKVGGVQRGSRMTEARRGWGRR